MVDKVSSAMKARVPEAKYGSIDHPLKIGGMEIPCYVLEDGKRVLVQKKMIGALGLSQGSAAGALRGDRLTKFVSGKALKPYVSSELGAVIKDPIKFLTPEKQIAYGYEATTLADVCEAVLKARDEGALQHQQVHVAAQCELLIRGWARVGIIALVDAATGYERVRARESLVEIFEKFIAKEIRAWVKTFPDEYYEQIFRLNGWIYAQPFPKKRPGVVGTWTNDLVYARLAPGVLKELKRVTPAGKRLHQNLTENFGYQKLKEHLAGIMALQRASASWRNFYALVERSYPKHADVPVLPFSDDDPK
jgi:hypothetical protein